VSDLYLKTTMLLARIPSAVNRRITETRAEIAENGDRGDNPVGTAILWIAGIGIAGTIVASMYLLGTRSSGNLDNVKIGDGK
jgi:hypothetical protein